MSEWVGGTKATIKTFLSTLEARHFSTVHLQFILAIQFGWCFPRNRVFHPFYPSIVHCIVPEKPERILPGSGERERKRKKERADFFSNEIDHLLLLIHIVLYNGVNYSEPFPHLKSLEANFIFCIVNVLRRKCRLIEEELKTLLSVEERPEEAEAENRAPVTKSTGCLWAKTTWTRPSGRCKIHIPFFVQFRK